MKFSKIRNIFIFSKKTNYLEKLIIWRNNKILKISKIWKFQKSNRFLLKINFFHKKSQKWPSRKNLYSDWNCNDIITWCSYSAKIKLQYMKNNFQVAQFHIMMVFINKNIFKQVHLINKLGRFGTGFPLAPVFELYLAMATSGEPSTWFPLE